MIKRFFMLGLLLALLVACGSATPPVGVSEQVSPDTAVDTNTEPETSTETEPPAPVASSDVEAVAAITPATTVAEAAIIRPQDQVKGASDPKVVIVEYGDFQ